MSVIGTAEQLLWLRDRGSVRRYLVELNAYNVAASQAEDIFIASEAFTDAEGDAYQPVLVSGLTLTQRLPSSLLGGARVSGGGFDIDNSNGQFDGWLTDYSWSGRGVTIYGIDPANNAWTTRADYLKLFVGFVEQVDQVADNLLRVGFTQIGASANIDIFAHEVSTPTARVAMAYGKIRNATQGGRSRSCTEIPAAIGP